MSRCFPFPPPGYESKIKADEPSVLKKEKHRENTKKKDRKEKEKKEKRDKDRTDEKRRDKKHKKEKNRDEKERDQEKDRHKDDGFLPSEKRAVRPPDVQLHKFSEKSKDWEKEGSVTLGEKRVPGQTVVVNGKPVSKNNHLASQTKTFKNDPGSVRRNIDEERKLGNQLPNKNMSAERQKDGVVKFVDSKENTNEKPAVVKKKDVLGFTGETMFSGNALGQSVVGQAKVPGTSLEPPLDGRETKAKQAVLGRMDGRAVSENVTCSGGPLPTNFIGMSQNRAGGMVRPLEKKLEQKLVLDREKESNYKKGEKIKEEDGEKPVHKDKKKEEKVKVASELKNHVQKLSKRDGGENHNLSSPIVKNENKKVLSASLSDGIQGTPNSGSRGDTSLLGKRKDIKLNGIYDEHITGPNKLAKTTDSTHPLTENGKSLEPCQNSAVFAARPPMNIKVERTFAPDETQRPAMNIKVDGNEHMLNDIKTGPITQSSRTTSKTERKSRVSAKPPHPDTKYLSQVLRVPKLDEPLDLDDQEWLFGSNSSQTKKPQVETSGVEVEPKVWANALWLEPVDVFALPYVIPH